MLLRWQPPVRRNPEQERSAFTLDAVMRAAEELLSERGLAGLKRTEVARLAGVGVCEAWLDTLGQTAEQPLEARLPRLRQIVPVASGPHRAHPEHFKLASDVTRVDSADPIARGMTPPTDAAQALTSARLMVSGDDAMIDCAGRVEPPVLAGQLFSVWPGIVQEAPRARAAAPGPT